jgi:hypothetical protein
MKRRFFLTAITLVAALGVARVAAQRRPASIVGVWRVVEVTTTGPNAATNKTPQPSLYIFTAKHYSQIADTGVSPRPAMAQTEAAKATADQLRASWGPFFANAGTYEIKGGEIHRRAIVAKNPAGMTSGGIAVSSFQVEGNTLTMTQKSSNLGPIQNPTTVKLVRLE